MLYLAMMWDAEEHGNCWIDRRVMDGIVRLPSVNTVTTRFSILKYFVSYSVSLNCAPSILFERRVTYDFSYMHEVYHRWYMIIAEQK